MFEEHSSSFRLTDQTSFAMESFIDEWVKTIRYLKNKFTAQIPSALRNDINNPSSHSIFLNNICAKLRLEMTHLKEQIK